MKRNIAALLSGTTFGLLAYDNEWKMDGDKIAVDGDGNPIWIAQGGAEQTVKGDAAPRALNEARQHREAKEAAETELAKYRDDKGKLLDPTIAKKAVETVSRIDAKTLIDAGEVDRVRDEIKSEFTTQLTEKDNALTEAQRTINTMKIDNVFNGSDFVRDRVNVPADMFRDSMSKFVKVNDAGDMEYYDRSGNRLMSKTKVGEYASGDEAFELLVEAHPQRDTILKAPPAGGTGGNGGGGNRGGSRIVKRADFDAAGPAQQIEYATMQNKGEIQIVD